jgi:hypothetical protein
MLKDAYAHGIPTGFSPPPVRVNNEQFSDNTIGTNDVLVIRGTLESTVNREVELYPYISVDPGRPNDRSDPSDWPRSAYPLYYDPASWYFRIEYNISSPLVLQPGEELDYEIRAYPLKTGNYHVHTLLVSDEKYSYNHHLLQFVGRGQTVIVAGGNVQPTMGEIAQFYMPLAIGAAALSFLVMVARKMAKADSGKIRKGVRYYFAAKASIETVWLSGIMIWLASAAYQILYSLETRLFHVLGTTAIIAAIAAGSYVAAIARPRLQRMFAVGAASVSFAFYLLLPYIDTGGFGWFRGQFDVNYSIMTAALIVNGAVLILSIMPRKEAKASKFANEPGFHNSLDRL